jgi:hypothetical protein
MDNNKLFDLLEKIDNKVDILAIEQGKQEIINLSNHEELRKIREDVNYHIKRTNLLEEQVTKIRGFVFYVSLTIGAIGAVTTILSNVWSVFR